MKFIRLILAALIAAAMCAVFFSCKAPDDDPGTSPANPHAGSSDVISRISGYSDASPDISDDNISDDDASEDDASEDDVSEDDVSEDDFSEDDVSKEMFPKMIFPKTMFRAGLFRIIRHAPVISPSLSPPILTSLCLPEPCRTRTGCPKPTTRLWAAR